MNYKKIVNEFNKHLKPQNKELRLNLISEELKEVHDAHLKFAITDNIKDKIHLAKELCDLIYVAAGGLIEGDFEYNEDGLKKENCLIFFECTTFSEIRFNHLIYFCEILANRVEIKDFEACFLAVHNSNMLKLKNPTYKNGKLQKGPDYVKPNLSAFV